MPDDDPWPVPKKPFWKEGRIEKDMGDKIHTLDKLTAGFVKEVTALQIIEALRKIVPKWQVECFDSKYNILPRTVWLNIIEQCPTARLRYSLPESDCNNYSFALKGWVLLNHWGINSVGWVGDFGGKHSFCVVPCWEQPKQEIEMTWIEPQNDESFKIGSQPCYNKDGAGLVLF